MTIPTWTAGFRPAVISPYERISSHAFGEEATRQTFDPPTIRTTAACTGKGGR
jgi:hypothetical protein